MILNSRVTYVAATKHVKDCKTPAGMLNCSNDPSPISTQSVPSEFVTDSSPTAEIVTLLTLVSKVLQPLAEESFDKTVVFVGLLCSSAVDASGCRWK